MNRWNPHQKWFGYWHKNAPSPDSLDSQEKYHKVVKAVFDAGANRNDRVINALEKLKKNINNKKLMFQVLKELKRFQINSSLHLFDEPDDTKGQILLGHTLNGHEVRMNTSEFCAHLLMVAGSGSGKSVTLLNLLNQFIPLVPSWGFDFFKRELRCILQKHDTAFVVRWHDLRFNPLSDMWMGILCMSM